MLILVLIVLVLSGCVSPQQRYAQTMNECQAIASQYNLGDAYQQFMHQCVNMQPSPVQAQQYFNQAAAAAPPVQSLAPQPNPLAPVIPRYNRLPNGDWRGPQGELYRRDAFGYQVIPAPGY